MSKEPNPEIVKHLESDGHECAIAAPVWHELTYGCHRLPRGKRRTALETYLQDVVLASFPVLAYDETAAHWHGHERARLEGLGRPAPYVDGQIAAIARVNGVQPPAIGLLLALPALLLVALMLSALGLLVSNAVRQLENFAGVMNFVIFPLFFLSSALYPLWKMRDSSEWLYWLCAINPFTHAVELVRFALYERFAGLALAVCLSLTLLFALLAVLTFNPQHAALRKQG